MLPSCAVKHHGPSVSKYFHESSWIKVLWSLTLINQNELPLVFLLVPELKVSRTEENEM